MAKRKKPAAPLRVQPRARRPRAQHGPPKGDFHEQLGTGWVEERAIVVGVICQLQWVRCHKACWCMKAEAPPWHGPYWFAYVANKRGKIASRYIGKKLTAAKVRAVAL